MFSQDIHKRALIFLIYFSSDLNVFVSFLSFTMNFSHRSKSVRQPAGCCLWCLWADRECSGRPEQRNKPWAPPAIKAHHPTLDQGGEKSVAQAITTIPWDFLFVQCAHLQHAKQKPGVIRVGTCRQNSKTAIKGVVNTREERGEKQNKKASHWHVKRFGTTAESKMYLTSVVNQQYMSLSRQRRRKDYPLLLLLWNTFSFNDKSVHHWWCFDIFLSSRN